MGIQEDVRDKVERWADFLFNDFRSFGLFFCISQDLYVTLAEHYALSKEDSKTKAGVVLNPSDAGQCLTELKRTEAFVRGLDEAVSLKKSQGRGPVRIFYAGCGPFATLVLPLTYRYKPEELQFTLLDFHDQSLRSATDLLKLLGKEDYCSEAVLGDAVTYTFPEEADYHICLTETLQRALTQECHVPIVQNLLGQLPEDVLLVPQEIRVGGLWAEPPGGSENRVREMEHDVELGDIIQLNARTVRENSFVRSVEAKGRAKPEQVFCLQTEIDVFGDWKLRRNESGLTCPHPLEQIEFQTGEMLRFEYEVGENPGLRLHRDGAVA